MGEWPDDFEDHELAEIWHCFPWEVQNAPIHYSERALLRKAIINQGKADWHRNQQNAQA